MLNRVILVGRLVKDPVARQGSTSVSSFTLALDDYSQKTQDGKCGTMFIDVTAFGKQADYINNFCRKGNLVGVDGKLRQRTYQAQDGNNVKRFEIVADVVRGFGLRDNSQNNDIPQMKTVRSEPIVDSKNIVVEEVIDEDIDF